jgi:DNA-binding beta-propeller fold protein YncE
MTTTDQNTNPTSKPILGLLRAVVVAGLTAGVFAVGVAPALAVPAHVRTAVVGEPGSGAGQLSLGASSEVAVSQGTGDVYVADTGNRRVDVFTSAGVFVRAFGADVGGSGVDVCMTSCVKGVSGSSPGEFEAPTLIAVDNSNGPSKGDVYVGDTGDSLISKFTGVGALITSWASGGQLGGFRTPGDERESLAGVAVTPAGGPFEGTLSVGDENQKRYWFNQDGSRRGSTCYIGNPTPLGLAVDTEASLYLLERGIAWKHSAECEQLGGEVGGEERGVGLAIDSSNNDLYIAQHAETGEGGDVQRFADTCERECTPIEEFAFEPGELRAPQGIVIDPGTHIVYVADSGTNQIDVYTVQNVEPPTVTPAEASEVSFTTAKLTGTVNPNGHLTTCRFEYALDAQFEGAKSVPCASNLAKGASPVTVEAQLTDLRGSAEYDVRLVAENRGIPGNTTPSSSVSFSTLTVGPPRITGPVVSAITATSAHFSGQINPNAPAGDPLAFDVNWKFECSPACPGLTGGTLPADNTSHEVSEEATGLQPGQRYEVALIGTNANGVPVPAGPGSFTTPAVAPGVISSAVAAASGTEATLSSQIDPGGAPTTYYYEYITEVQYMSNGETFQSAEKTPESAPVGEAGNNKDHEANVTIVGLTANTNYRFRILAKNDITSTSGEAELLFTHNPEGSSGCANEALREENDSLLLPDCRAFEQVSPADNAEAFVPFGQNEEAEGLVGSLWPMQAAASGEALAYVAEPSSRSGCGEGTGNAGAGEGDEQLATRSASGWVACDIQPLASSSETTYQAFSSSLGSGVLRTGKEEALQSGVPGHCDQLYSRAGTGPFTALFTPQAGGECSGLSNFFAGGTSDYSQIAFESKEALAEGAIASSGELGQENIYDSSAGSVRTVNVLPGASPSPAPQASVGALSSEPQILLGTGAKLPAANLSNAVSANGSQIFWTNLTGASDVIYTRKNPAQEQSEITAGKCTEAEKACTQQVSAGPATYQTATPDGRYAYYTEAGKLWRYDTQSESREELAGTGADVQGVIGVNETGQDGAYLYFVAEGKLASGAQARKCEAAPSGQAASEEEAGKAPAGYGCNLYVIHEGQTSLAAVLLASDNEFKGNTFGTSQPKKGDWRPVLGYRSAELSANGQNLVFMSNRQLTSYQNVNRNGECGGGDEHPTHSCTEIYLYNAQSNNIACASCTPSGAPPIHEKDAENLEGRATYLPGDFGSITHARRFISNNGSRVFFNSDQPLSPQDKNGVQDVYEWEAPGSGSCADGSSANGDGCITLLSGGTSTSGSLLLDADETGDNAFFASRAALVPGGSNGEKPNVFDARVDGGFKGAPGATVQPPECKSAEACKPPAGEPPVESFPASAAFSGAGNLVVTLEAAKPPVKKPTVRKLTRAQELVKALKICKRERKASRVKCEALARKRYGPSKAKKAHNKRRKNR